MPNIREGLSESADFERPFRDKLTNLEGTPPQDSWQAIQHALDRDRDNRRRWYVPLVFLLLVGGGGFISGYLVSQRQMEYEREAEAMDTNLHNITALGREQPNIAYDESAGNQTGADVCVDRAPGISLGMAVSADRANAMSFAQETPRELLCSTDDVRENSTGLSDGLLPEIRRVNESGRVTMAVTDSVERTSEALQEQVVESADSSANDRKKPTHGKWVLQLAVSGSYTFKKITPSEDLFYLTDLTNKNKFSWHNAGYQLAARVRRETGAKTTLTAGMSWSRWQTYTAYNYYDVIADSTVVHQITAKSMEVSTYFSTSSNEMRTTLHQMGLSVGLLRKIRLLQHEQAVLLEASLYQRIYSSTRSAQPDHHVVVQPTLFLLKAGVEKTVDIEGWRFTVMPFVQRYLGSLYTSESIFQFKPLQVGLEVGILMPLRK